MKLCSSDNHCTTVPQEMAVSLIFKLINFERERDVIMFENGVFLRFLVNEINCFAGLFIFLR